MQLWRDDGKCSPARRALLRDTLDTVLIHQHIAMETPNVASLDDITVWAVAQGSGMGLPIA